MYGTLWDELTAGSRHLDTGPQSGTLHGAHLQLSPSGGSRWELTADPQYIRIITTGTSEGLSPVSVGVLLELPGLA